jgi:hypothetical protein
VKVSVSNGSVTAVEVTRGGEMVSRVKGAQIKELRAG